MSTALDGFCVAREDALHCECWWDGEICCSCGHDGNTDPDGDVERMWLDLGGEA